MESIPHRQLSSEVAVDVGRGVRFRYRSIRSARARAILTIQHEISRAFRKVLDSEGFLEVLAPIIGPVTDPGIQGAGTIEVPFYGETYVLMTSMILYKQMTVASFPRVYSFSPNVRLEASASSTTGRHLVEFYQLDLEVAHGTCEDVMMLGDTLMFEVIRTVRQKCKEQLATLGRTLHLPPRTLPQLTFAEAIELLLNDGFTLDAAEEIPWEAECHLSNHFSTPFWVTNSAAASSRSPLLTLKRGRPVALATSSGDLSPDSSERSSLIPDSVGLPSGLMHAMISPLLIRASSYRNTSLYTRSPA